ncbi:hypothetical protein H5410_030764 [Solanum commersonii]|uniref:Uncharacterized protein n=1 Tax=Solanum commersonii TaxID=4109 RepID=A0A9J5YGI9_SOLCO|nr:hypothetical protein H5410_030764 [Solanum commersonii]
MQNLVFHLVIDFDSDMTERTTSSRTEMQHLLIDSPIRVITCKASNIICRSLVITKAESSVSLFSRPCFVISVSVGLIFVENVVVSFDVNLSVWTVMCAITFDVKQH